MYQGTLIGVDTSKGSFSVYGITDGRKFVEREIKRDKVLEFFAKTSIATVVMEACGSSNYWGRELKKLGHEVKLLPPKKVTPFRKTNKNDKNDALAIVSAATSPEMIFGAVKEVWQQDIQSLHRIRERHIKNQTALVNEMRGLLMEYGITITQGINHVRGCVPEIIRDSSNNLTPLLRSAVADLHCELLSVTDHIERIDKQLLQIFRKHDACQRIAGVEGIGVITATAIIGSVPPAHKFKNGRQFAAWLGLTPRHVQTGGKDSKPIMLGITKQGDSYLRKLLVQGAMCIVAQAKNLKDKPAVPIEVIENEAVQDPAMKSSSIKASGPAPCRKRKKPTIKKMARKEKSLSRLKWLQRLVEDKGMQKAAVAFANRNARVIWALLKTGQNYDVKRDGGLCNAA